MQAENSSSRTLKKELLSGLVGIHGTICEHCVNLLVSVIVRDLLDVLDHLLHTAWDGNPGTRTAHLCKPQRKPAKPANKDYITIYKYNYE